MVISTIIGVIAAGGVSAFSFGTAALGWASVGLSILTKVVLGAALRALMPKPSIGANRGYETTAIGTALDHQVIYGKVRVGGVRIYDETTGTNNSYLHRIIAVAGHEIESFDKIYINDSYVNYADIDAGGNISSVVDPDGTTSTRYNDHVRIKFKFGSPTQSAESTLAAESAHWTNAHKLSGIAYMYIRMKFDADVFPNGIPDFTAEVKGKKVYDPRTSTTVWSDNPALCVRDYLTASYGISEAVANIDDTLVTSAANVSDQLVGSPATKIYAGGVYKIKTVGSTNFTLVGAANNNVGTVFTATGVAVGTGVVETERYTCNGAFTTNSTPYEMIEALLTSMDGSIWYAQGKWRMKPAYWTTPVLDLDEDDLRSSLSVSTRHSRASNFNTVKGTFRGSESNWQTTDYPQVPENTASNPNPFLTVDNGQESVADVDLTFTDNSIEARRIARITLERNRQQLTVSGSFGLNTLQLQVGDNIRLTNSRFGWTNKEFEVVAWNFGLQDDLDLQVQMTLRETSESVYDEVTDSVVYERDNTTLASPFDTAEPQSLSSAATAFVNDDGTTVPSITFSWSVANPSLVELFEFEWKLTTDTNYNSTVLKETSWTLAPAESSKSYDYRVRSISPLGVRSVLKYSTSAAATVDDQTIPNAPSGLNVSGGYAATTVEWVAPTANTDASAIKDLFQYEVYRGTSSNPTTLVGRVAGTTFSDIGLANNTTYHYRVKALDFTGNKSAFSSNGSATTNPALTNGTDGSSIFPVYATSSAGANQSFSPTGKTFVTFYEGLTSPSLPLSGQTFVAYVGEDGSNGDIFKTIYLYDASVTQPSAISITSGFTPSTGDAASTGTWTTTVPSISSGQVLWIASMVVKQTAGAGNYVGQGVGWVRIQAQGYDGDTGSDAPRFASRTLYTNPAVVTPADTTPSATITWSSGAISSITSGWSLTPPTQVASSSQKVWTSNLLFSDVSPPFSSTSATGTTAIQGTSFSGLVSFTGGDFALDGATITNIDGGNITTGTIAANQINANAITSKNLKVGNIAIDSSAKPTSGAGMFVVGVNNAGASGTTAGDFVVGSTQEFVSWDTSAGILSIQGEIVNVGPEYINGRLNSKRAVVRTDLGTQTSGNQSLNSLLTQYGGAGLYGFGLVGGGGSGAGRETNNDSAKLFGGGAGGMAMFVYEWDGSESIQVNLGVGGAGITNVSNANTNGNAGTNSTFTIAGSVRVTANAGGAGSQTFTNNSLVQSNNAGSVTWADGNNGNTNFPNFSHTCLSGHGGAVSRSNSLACGGGGIQITPWNPTDVFTYATDPTSTGGTLTTGGNGATSGGCPWGSGILATGGNSNTSASAYRLDPSTSPATTTQASPPITRVIQPTGSWTVAVTTSAGLRAGNGAVNLFASVAGEAGGLFCGGGGANTRRVDTNATAGDGGLGGGGGAGLADSGSGRVTTGDGGDGCLVIWRIS